MTAIIVNAYSQKKLDALTGLRGITACYVLLSHIWYQIWPAVAAPFGYWLEPEGVLAWLTGWLYYGHFGVVVFIVLSGFCLMRSVLKNDGLLPGKTLDFFKRRARRILPAYYFALALSIFFLIFFIDRKMGTQWDISLPLSLGGVLSHIFLLQDFFATTQINYVFWSVALEVQLYLMFPIVVWCGRKVGMTMTLSVVSGIVYGTIGILSWIEFEDLPPQFLGFIVYFMFGMVCAVFVQTTGIRKLSYFLRAYWRELALINCFIVIMLCLWWGHEVAEGRFIVLDTIVALASCCLLIGITEGNQRSAARSVFESKAAVTLGTFSYSLYLIHAPILQLIWQYTIAPLDLSFANQFFMLLLIGLPICLMCGYCFFLLCERPFVETPSIHSLPYQNSAITSSHYITHSK